MLLKERLNFDFCCSTFYVGCTCYVYPPFFKQYFSRNVTGSQDGLSYENCKGK